MSCIYKILFYKWIQKKILSGENCLLPFQTSPPVSILHDTKYEHRTLPPP